MRAQTDYQPATTTSSEKLSARKVALLARPAGYRTSNDTRVDAFGYLQRPGESPGQSKPPLLLDVHRYGRKAL